MEESTSNTKCTNCILNKFFNIIGQHFKFICVVGLLIYFSDDKEALSTLLGLLDDKTKELIIISIKEVLLSSGLWILITIISIASFLRTFFINKDLQKQLNESERQNHELEKIIVELETEKKIKKEQI